MNLQADRVIFHNGLKYHPLVIPLKSAINLRTDADIYLSTNGSIDLKIKLMNAPYRCIH